MVQSSNITNKTVIFAVTLALYNMTYNNSTIKKMPYSAQFSAYWPGIDADITEYIK